MRLYTRSGDDGTTGLFGSARVSKDDARVEAYGSVDETNAAVGCAVAALSTDVSSDTGERLRAMLVEIQSRLFDVGADLATPPDSEHADKIARLDDRDVAQIERWIDEVDEGNEPMKAFVLPGGTEVAARLRAHIANTG